MTAPDHGRPFWIGLAAGVPLMAGAAWALVDELGAGGAADVARWAVGANLVHDLLIAPVVCVTGWLLARLLPRVARAPVATGAIATGVLAVVAVPIVRGYGRDAAPANPTVQPLDGTTATLWVIGAVWATVVVWLAVRLLRARGAGSRGLAPPARTTPGPEPIPVRSRRVKFGRMNHDSECDFAGPHGAPRSLVSKREHRRGT
jgi:hypothetical protein